jgi:hypothetical protein
MSSVLSIIQRLSDTSSRLEKEAILKQNSKDPRIKETFRLALDPSINFYLKKIPEPLESAKRISLMQAYESMGRLTSRELRGYDARDYLGGILGSLTSDDQEVLKRIIGRNLKCGVSESTVEKIWPDLCLSYPCQLVSPMDSKTKLKFPCMAQTKMDGMRFNAIVTDGSVSYRSRNGKELDLGDVLDREFLAISNQNMVYDGELLIVDGHGTPVERKTGNGILTKFQRGTGSKKESETIRAIVWDAIPLADFWAGSCPVPYVERFDSLKTRMGKKIRIVYSQTVKSLDEAQELYQHMLHSGEEGLVLKDPKGPWENKRVKHQVKMKAILDADLKVVGFTPGTGKYEGKIGSLLVESADGKVRTSVGTGMTDVDRSKDYKSTYEDKIVEIRYNSRIGSSIFLPVFVSVREDKSEADLMTISF